MYVYESISILKPSLNDDEVQKITSKLESIVKKSGELLGVENWGKKKLAYEVQKEKRGIYLLIRFRGDGKNIPELERNYRFDDNIIKFLTVKLGKRAVQQLLKSAKPGPAPESSSVESSVESATPGVSSASEG